MKSKYLNNFFSIIALNKKMPFPNTPNSADEHPKKSRKHQQRNFVGGLPTKKKIESFEP